MRALQRRFELCIPRNQTVRPCSPFHTSVSDLYISQDRSTYFSAAKQALTYMVGIYKSLTDTYMNVEIGTEAAQFPFWDYFFLVFVQYLCSVRLRVSTCAAKMQPTFYLLSYFD
jgi:hypothetical protein